MKSLEALKELCSQECYEELDECSFIKEVEDAPDELVRRAVKEVLFSARERGCDPSKALAVLINLLGKKEG